MRVTIESVAPSDPEFGTYASRLITEPGCGNGAIEQFAADLRTARVLQQFLEDNPDVLANGEQFRVRVHPVCCEGRIPTAGPLPHAGIRPETDAIIETFRVFRTANPTSSDG